MTNAVQLAGCTWLAHHHTAPHPHHPRHRPPCAAALRPLAATSGSGQIVPPFNVVITGGSKGVGRALAAEFLKAGDNVVICARDGALRGGARLILVCGLRFP